MDFIDQQMRNLESLSVALTRQPDFDAFWQFSLQQCRQVPLDLQSTPVDHPIDLMEVQDVRFSGTDGTRVESWLLLPRHVAGKVPVVVVYHGLGGSRGLPVLHLPYVAMGCAVMAVDCRLQSGMTGYAMDAAGGANGHTWAMGLDDPRRHYLLAIYTDSYRAIDAALQCPRVDAGRVCVDGGSQGGGLSLAMAALHPSVTHCMADVPSMCWFDKRTFDRSGAGAGVAQFLQRFPDMLETASRTLSYFDNLNLADRIKARVLVSVGLKDPVVPADTTYAAYNRITSPKEIIAYPFGDHGGGGLLHHERKLAWLRRHLLS